MAYFKLIFICFICFFYQNIKAQKECGIHEFIKSRSEKYTLQHDSALKVFHKNIQLESYSFSDGRTSHLQYFIGQAPLFFETHNYIAAELIGVDLFYESSLWHSEITGKNEYIGVWDAGHILNNHQEFSVENESRIVLSKEYTHFKNHSTHVGGTIGGSGFNSRSKGMANECMLYSADYMNDMAEMADMAYSTPNFLSNHSYGPVSGWSYNSNEEIWYWYGDLGVSSVEDYKFGLYGSISADLDQLAYMVPNYLMVVSSGNDKFSGPESQPVSHMVWTDKWKVSNDVREIDGGSDGFDCIGMNGVAKNVLTVGAVSYTDGAYSVTSFSSTGPTDDGRIKPDIVAPGINLYSSLSDSADAYGYYSGTSMSAAVVSGGILLLKELQQQLQPNVYLSSSTYKALLIHTANQIVPYKGPAYHSGWGLVDFFKAHELIEENVSSGGEIIKEGTVSNPDQYVVEVYVEENSTFKTTVCWIDPPGENVGFELNASDPKLINDLNLTIIRESDGAIFYPWVLNADDPGGAAVAGVNTCDNVEQVLIENCAQGFYKIYLDGSGIDLLPQSFSMIISGHQFELGLMPPQNLDGFYDEKGVEIWWDAPINTSPNKYDIFKNDEFLYQTTDTCFLDEEYKLNQINTYKVIAIYGVEDMHQSCFSNTLSIIDLPVFNVPYESSFENDQQNWQTGDNVVGWQWGDKDYLNSYYMKFDGNDSYFMGINSEDQGSGIHVRDYLVSPPVLVNESAEIEVSFRYLLNNQIYQTNDSLSVIYRTSINEDWKLVSYLPSVASWSTFLCHLKLEEGDKVIQLGFFYDDNGEWGMGAGIDDVFIIKDTSSHRIETHESFFRIALNSTSIDIYAPNAYTEKLAWGLYDLSGRVISKGNTMLVDGFAAIERPNVIPGIFILKVRRQSDICNIKFYLD